MNLFTPDFMGSAHGAASEPWLSGGFYDPNADPFRSDNEFDPNNNPVDHPETSSHPERLDAAQVYGASSNIQGSGDATSGEPN